MLTIISEHFQFSLGNKLMILEIFKRNKEVSGEKYIPLDKNKHKSMTQTLELGFVPKYLTSEDEIKDLLSVSSGKHKNNF